MKQLAIQYLALDVLQITSVASVRDGHGRGPKEPLNRSSRDGTWSRHPEPRRRQRISEWQNSAILNCHFETGSDVQSIVALRASTLYFPMIYQPDLTRLAQPSEGLTPE